MSKYVLCLTKQAELKIYEALREIVRHLLRCVQDMSHAVIHQQCGILSVLFTSQHDVISDHSLNYRHIYMLLFTIVYATVDANQLTTARRDLPALENIDIDDILGFFRMD